VKNYRSDKKSRSVALTLLGIFATWTVGNPALSATPPAVPGNLTSTTASVPAGSLSSFNAVNIMVGRSNLRVTPSMQLTPAEYLACQQVLTTGRQTLMLGELGNAVGGRFMVASSTLFSDLLVPRGVTVFDRVSSTAQSLSVTGLLQNAGTLSVINSLAGIVNTSIQAAAIENLAGGIISAGNNVNLALYGANGITNHGVISAVNNLSLVTPALVNNGLIASSVGNVNITAPAGVLAVNGAGNIQALVGNINVTALSSTLTPSLTMLGGNYLSRELNVNACGGNVLAYVDDVSGLVNMKAASTSFGAATPSLKFGTLDVSGDPTYFNTGGSLLLNSIAATGGFDLALLAAGNVVVTGGTIDTSAPSPGPGDGGNLLIVAGANLTATPPASGQQGPDATTTITFSGSSTSGGGINLTGVSQINTTGTSDGTATANGGNVTMAAFTGTGAGGGLVPGSVNLGSAAINTYGNGLGNGGNVGIYAGATVDPTGGHSINGTGKIETGGVGPKLIGSYVGGDVYIGTVTPVISSLITVIDGTVQAGSGTITAGALQPISLKVGDISTSPECPKTLYTSLTAPPSPDAGSVTLAAGTTLTAGKIWTLGLIGLHNPVGPAGNGGNGGDVSVSAGSNITLGQIVATGYDGGTGISGDGGAGGKGGDISVASTNGGITISSTTNGVKNASLNSAGGSGNIGADEQAGGAGGDAGSITLTAPSGVISIGTVEASGGGGAGGNGGFAGGAGGDGGAGGNVTMLTNKTITVNGFISAAGGGGGGAGGADAVNGAGAGGGGGGSTFCAGYGGNALLATAGGGGGGGSYLSQSGGASGSTPGKVYDDKLLKGGAGADGSVGVGGVGGWFSVGGAGGSSGNAVTGDAGGNGGQIGAAGLADANNTVAGGAAGAGGTISLTGQLAAVKGTFYTVYNPALNQPTLKNAPHFGDSILTAGPVGNVQVTTYGTDSKVKTPLYAADGNLTSTILDATLVMTVTGSAFAVGASGTNGAAGPIESSNANLINTVAFGQIIQKATVANTGKLIINVGGSGPQLFINNQKVTPAELIALNQVSAKLPQTLLLNSNGTAASGTFTIDKPNIPSAGFTILVIPTNVTATSKASLINVKQVGTPGVNNDGAVVIDGTLTFNQASTLNASKISGTGSITSNAAGGLTLSASAGDIAQAQGSSVRFEISTPVLSTLASGNTYLNNTMPAGVTTLTLKNVLSSHGVFELVNNNGSIATKSGIAATGVSLAAPNASIQLGGNIISPGAQVLLAVSGAGTITQTTASTIDTSSLALNGGTGAITLGSSIPGGAQVFAGQLTVNTGGAATIVDNVAVAMNGSAVLGNFSLTDIAGIDVTANSVFGQALTATTNTFSTSNFNIATGATLSVPGTLSTLTIQSPAGQNLAITGGGTVTNNAGINVTSPSGAISFPSTAGTITFNTNATHGVTFSAINGSFSVDDHATAVHIGGGNAVINSNTVFNPGRLTADGGVTINIGTTPKTLGTLASAGDFILNSTYLVNSQGENLAIVAGGNILVSGVTKIDLSSSKANAGNLTVLAGVTYTSVPDPTHPAYQLVTVTGTSGTGGNVNFTGVTLNTGSTGGSGGNVLITASQGSANLGTVFTGAITSSSTKANGGNVQIVAPGGISVSGVITTTGVYKAGSVSLVTAPPSFANVAVIYGYLTPLAAVTATLPPGGSGPAVTVTGNISTNATGVAGLAGDLNILALSNVQLNNTILTSGYRAGAVNLTSVEGSVTVLKDIKAFGLSQNTIGVAGLGGDVSINTAALATVKGSILANGGVAKGTGHSGNAGDVTLATSTLDNSNSLFTGNILVTGYINAAGGSQSGSGYGLGGDAGSVTIMAGAFQVQGTTTVNTLKASIVNTYGSGSFANGTIKPVDLTTYSIQQIPSNFNLTSTTANVVALPGGLFEVENKTVVNGTAGIICSGVVNVTSKTDGTGKFADGIYNFGGASGVTISVVGANQTVLMPSVSSTPVQITPRQLVTPACAVALFQTSLGGGTTSQTIGLDGNGRATSVNPNAAGISQITVPGYDLPASFSAFNLSAADIANGIQLNVTGLNPVLNLSATTLANLSVRGTIDFPTASNNGIINLGTLVFSLPAGATLSSAANLGLQGSGAWTNAGTITAAVGNLMILNPGKATKLTNTGTIGVLDILMPATGAPSAITLVNKSNTVANAGFGALQLPTSYASAQLLAPGAKQQAAVALNLAYATAAGTLQTAVLDGTIPTGTIGSLTITGNANPTTASLPTPITLATTAAGYTLDKGLTVKTNGALNMTGGTLALTKGTLTLSGSSITTTGTAAINCVSGSVKLTAVNTISTSATGLISATAGINLNTTSAAGAGIVVGDLNVTAGSIKVVAAGGFVNTAVGANITAASAVVGTKATIALQASNTSNGSILIGDNTQMGTSGAGGSTVSLYVGTSAKAANALTPGAQGGSMVGITVVNTAGGIVYAGKTPTAIIGPGAGNLATLTADGTSLIMDSPAAARTITFGDGVNVTADPPAALGMAATASSGLTAALVHASAAAPSGVQAAPVVPVSGVTGTQVLPVSGATATQYDCLAGVRSNVLVPRRAGFQTLAAGSDARGTLQSGEFFLNPLADTTVRTRFGNVILKKDALVALSVEAAGLRVIGCSRPGDVRVQVGDSKIDVQPGTEVMVSERKLSADEYSRADGIGRRNFSSQQIAGGMFVSGSEVSVVSLLKGRYAHTLAHPATAAEKRIVSRMLKTAAAIQQLTVRRGAYQARQQADGHADTQKSASVLSWAGR
jgi:hypothetical protein